MALGKYSWRAVRQRPLRVVLTFLSIVIGVGGVVAVLLATATTRAAQREMLRAVSGKADLEVVSDSSGGFAYQLLARIRQTAGVELAAPTIRRLGTLFHGEKKARTQILGIDPRIDQEIRDYKIVTGNRPATLNEILLDRSFAESLDLSVGSEVKLLGAGGLLDFRITGLVDPSGSTSLGLTGAAYLVLPAAQRLFRLGNNIDLVLVKVAPTEDVDVVAQRLRDLLQGHGVTVRRPRTSSDMARETMYATENGLLLAVAFSLLIASFLIYNTFQMAVGERRKQLGILRAVGATRRQVAGLILAEALVLSVLAAVVGCGLGYWGAGLLNGATERLLQVELPTVHWTPMPFVLGCLVGVVVAMVGALVPARRAARVHPMEAIRDIDTSTDALLIRRSWPAALTMLPLGAGILVAAVYQWLPVGGDVVGIVLILLGCVLMVPRILRRATGALVLAMAPWIAPEAMLAQRQLLRHIGRSSLTVGVLFIAISACTGMAGNILDNVDNVRTWYSRTIIGDFFVRASLPDFTTGLSADLPPELGQRLRQIPGVKTVAPLRFVTAQSGEDSLLIVARPLIDGTKNFFDLIDQAPGDVLDRLRQGEVVVGSVLAERRKLKVGDTLTISADTGKLELRIAGIANDYMAGGLTVYMTTEKAEELLGAGGASVFVITAEDNQRAEVEKRLAEICKSEGLILQSYAELVEFIDSVIEGVVASLWMLLALGCIIAAMGLVNTLTMNILEQTREIGMLRVVAMTRRQVRTMVVAQAMQLGVLGLVPGALAGVFVAYAIGQSAMAVLGHDVEFRARPGLVLGCLVLGLFIVLASAWLPAQRAARLKLSDALHYE